MSEEVIADKKIGGVIATYTIERDFRTWNELEIKDFKVDNLIEFLSMLPKGEFEFNNENDEAISEFDTLDDIDEFLAYSMEITGDPYGKDKEGVISFYVVYNGEDNHETFKSLVEQFNLNDYFEYEIKLKKIPKKELNTTSYSVVSTTICGYYMAGSVQIIFFKSHNNFEMAC